MRLSDAIRITANQDAAYNAGRDAVYAKTGNYRNACAATLSVWLQIAQVFQPGELYTWTAGVVRALEEDHGFIRGTNREWSSTKADMDGTLTETPGVRAGDVVVTMDRNHNNAPDHVFLAIANDTEENIKAIDNTHDGKPYSRNLGSGTYTPMDYVLRQPMEYPNPNHPTRAALENIRDALHLIYKYQKHIPPQAKRLLNMFANNSFLDPVRDG